jgi:hypothetical protein
MVQQSFLLVCPACLDRQRMISFGGFFLMSTWICVKEEKERRRTSLQILTNPFMSLYDKQVFQNKRR